MNRSLQGQAGEMNSIHSKAISQLVNIVKNTGDKLLNGEIKLALTTTILTYLNDILTELLDEDTENSFQVQKTDYSKQSFYEDFQCLYDFIQKSAGLKITRGQQTLQGNVNVSRFHSLKIFEIKKIPIHLVVGLQNVKDKLTTIICSRCLHKLKDLFELCGGDMTEKTPWQNLSVAILSYNGIEQFDDSLKLLPNLEVLDISHNYIKRLENFDILKKLKYLNIGYNRLENFAIPSNCDPPHLKCLVLRNNNLEYLNGFNHLEYLEQLDVGYNCLSDHSTLQTLKSLLSLKLIWLDGNPLSYHPDHRRLTIERLHPVVVKNQFHLDGVCLSHSETLYIKQFECYSDGSYAPIPVNVSLNNDLLECSCSHNSISGSHAALENFSVTNDITNNLAQSTYSKGQKKKGKIREAKILENITNLSQNDSLSQSSKSNYLQAKEQMENFREQYGPDWLVASTRLVSSSNSPLLSSVDDVIKTEMSNSSSTEHLIPLEKPISDSRNMDLSYENTITKRNSSEILSQSLPNFLPVHKDANIEHKFSDNDLGYSSSGAVDHSHFSDEIETVNSSKICVFSDDEDTELSSKLFIVKKIDENKTLPLLLIVKEKFLCEKNIQGYTLEKLDLRGLLSIQKMPNFECRMKLIFDSSRKDRRQRIYTFDEKDEYEKFYRLLQPVMELKRLEEMESHAFQCLKCEAQFSKYAVNFSLESSDVNKNSASNQKILKEIQVCPICKSDMIMELDELPTPKNRQIEEESVKPVVSTSKESKSRSISLNHYQHSHQSSSNVSETLLAVFKKQKKTDCINVSKSFPATPIQQRKLKTDSFSELMKHQKERGKLEQLMRKELFTTNLNVSKILSKDSLYQSKSCGHSPESSSKINIDKNADDDISLIENEMRQDHGDFVDSLLQQSMGSISDGIRILFNSSRSLDNHGERSNSLIEDEINCNLPSNLTESIGGNEIIKSQSGNEDNQHLIPHPGTMRRSESDITILSNPSQSSISVLSTPSGDIATLDAIAESTFEMHKQIHKNYSELMKNSIYPRSSSPLSGPLSSDEEQHTFKSGCERSLQCSPSLNEAKESISSGSVSSSISAAFEQMSDVHPVPSPISQFSQGSRLHGTSSQSTVRSGDRLCSSESIYYSSDNISPSQQESQNQQFVTCANNNLCEIESSSRSNFTLDANEHSQSNFFTKSVKDSTEDFSQIDHRLHLYLDMKIFEDGEVFDSILKTNIIVLGKSEEFPGMLIMSTKNIYIYKIIGREDNEPKKWIEKIDVHPLPSLTAISLHLASQGFLLEFKNNNSRASYIFLLRDAFRCNNYFGYLTDHMKQDVFSDSVESISLTQELMKYLQGTLDKDLSEEGINNNDKEIVLYVMGYKIEITNGNPNSEPVSLVVTPAHIIIVLENFQWHYWKSKSLPEYKNGPFQVLQQECIKNLTQLEKFAEQSNQLKLHFFNEDTTEETVWHIATETETSLNLFINAIKDPWEKMFDLGLQVIEVLHT